MSDISEATTKNAHYHAIKASAAWKAFVEAEADAAVDSADERRRTDAKRKRETTYARGELGGH